MRGSSLKELSSKQATIRNEGSMCGGERAWRGQISERQIKKNRPWGPQRHGGRRGLGKGVQRSRTRREAILKTPVLFGLFFRDTERAWKIIFDLTRVKDGDQPSRSQVEITELVVLGRKSKN